MQQEYQEQQLGEEQFQQEYLSVELQQHGCAYRSCLCYSDLSLSNIQCAYVSVTNSLSASNEMFEGVLGSGPSIIYHICHSPDHNAAICSLRYQPRSTTNFPTMASFTLAERSKYLGSATSSYMTMNEGILSSKTLYSGSVQVEVGNGIYCLLLTSKIYALKLVIGRFH